MITPEKVIATLEKSVAMLKSLSGQQINGFAIIIPPEGDPIDFCTLGSQSDQKAFFEYLTNKIKASVETNQYGGVGARAAGMR